MAESAHVEILANATDDAFKSSRLERMLSSFTASYKLYWLKGIFDEVVAGRTQMSFERIAARMVAAAWYPVIYFRLNLGATDILARTVSYVRSSCGLFPDSTPDEILNTLSETDDPQVRRELKKLCAYVPYRLIRPFYSDRFADERTRNGSILDARVNALVIRFNREDAAGAPYRFDESGSGVEVDADWARYFCDNRHVIQGWFDMRLITYLQARNPSVPAIPLKIYPPVQRDLSAARRYWEEAIADHAFSEVYSGVLFDEVGFASLGPMSVDHFIPWSFVLHDEPWNLAPMFRNTNSSKGDRLPDIGEYLEPFCRQQFDALMTLRERSRHKKMVESYLSVDPQVLRYERGDVALASFSDSVSRVVVPLHQIARNQGFPIWELPAEYAFLRA